MIKRNNTYHSILKEKTRVSESTQTAYEGMLVWKQHAYINLVVVVEKADSGAITSLQICLTVTLLLLLTRSYRVQNYFIVHYANSFTTRIYPIQ